jgi:hypothetical protein
MLQVWKIRFGSSLSDKHPASLPKVAARGLVSSSMRSRQELRNTYPEFESHSLRQRPSKHCSSVRAPGSFGPVVACFSRGLRTCRMAGLAPGFSVGPIFSGDLCTLRIWYRASEPRIFEHSFVAELEVLSLQRFLKVGWPFEELISGRHLSVFVIAFLHALYVSLFVTETGVFEAGRQYGHQPVAAPDVKGVGAGRVFLLARLRRRFGADLVA